MSRTTTDTQRPNRPARRHTASNTGARPDVRARAPESFRLRPTALGVALHGVLIGSLGAGAIALPQQAHAQPSGANSAAATALPPGDAVKSFSIPAGPLDAALDRFARVAGVNLSYDAALVAGLNTQGLNGSFATAAGLVRLLEGSGLEALAQPGGGYSLRKAARAAAPASASAAAQQVPTLPQVTVTAPAERSPMTENTGSYTANTSAAMGLNLSLRETPQAVTVITRQRLDDQALNELGSILAQAPGISFSQYGGYAAFSHIYSRGYRITNYDVDGLPSAGALSTGGSGYSDIASLDTAIYDSVTVVRGATGLLHGTGDPSGSVSLVRKRPTKEFQASIAQSLGRWNRRRSVGDIGGSLNEAGTLRGRLVAAHDEGDSWVDRYEGKKHIAYGVLEADLGERTLLALTLEHQRARSRGDAQGDGFDLAFTDGSLTPFSIGDSTVADWSRYRRTSTGASVRLEHWLNDDWRVSLNYSRSSADMALKYGNLWGLNASDGSTSNQLRTQQFESDTDAFNVSLTGSYALFGRRHDLVAGANGSLIDLNVPYDITDWFGSQYGYSWWGWNGSNYGEPDWSSYTASQYRTKTRQHGVYLATRLRPRDDLAVIVGGRLSTWKIQTHNTLTGAVTDDRKESNVFTPYAGVVYDLSEQLSAYASYTENFNPQSYLDINNNPLDPEKGKNYELGLKGEWFGGRLNASAAVFQARKENVADRIFGTTAYRAIAQTRSKGWEVEVSGALTPRWQVQAGYTRSLAKDSSGNILNSRFQPEHHFKLFTTYAPASVRGLSVGAGLTWQSELYFDYNGLRDLYTQKAYALAHLQASYAFNSHWHLAVNLNNVFDKRARVSATNHMYVAPRNLLATLKYQF